MALVLISTFVGVCEALATLPDLFWDAVPNLVAMPIAGIGFVAFILLVGPFGNAAVAVGLFLLLFLRWRWPLWRGLAASAPFLYVTYQLSPKPW